MAEMRPWDPSCGIKKTVLHAGQGEIPDYPDSTKVTFHYQTKKLDGTSLDDSRTHDKPMELYLGKKFKLEVWETCIKSMRLGEVASFTVDKILIGPYPMVAKSLRDIHHGKTGHHQSHCCGLTLHEHGLGYKDLDEILKNPEDLEFIIDLQKVELPGEFKKETWTMDVDEKLAAIPRLKEEGNKLYSQKDYSLAADKYAEAIGMLEQLMIKEKPGDEDWTKLDQMKIPYLLNYSQCKLFLKDYYPVIEHTSEVIKKDPENVKALFRRAKAHVGAWNPTEAKEDFNKVMDLDQSLQKAVRKELKQLEDMQHAKDAQDREKLKGKMFG